MLLSCIFILHFYLTFIYLTLIHLVSLFHIYKLFQAWLFAFKYKHWFIKQNEKLVIIEIWKCQIFYANFSIKILVFLLILFFFFSLIIIIKFQILNIPFLLFISSILFNKYKFDKKSNIFFNSFSLRHSNNKILLLRWR